MVDLFANDAKELVLRDYQALDSARENIRKGHRRQILCAPTGAGKTIIGLGMMKAAREVGSNSAFITDRSALIDHTSVAMDLYGIDHGVMQADHWRCRPGARVQLVSAQTLGRRLGNGGYVDRHLRDLRFVLIDEAHTLYRSTLDWLDTLPASTAIIGLRATPFTRSLGRHYQAIVNVATTDGLIESGMLCRPHIYAAVEMDTSGVAVRSTGEWDEHGLEQAGVKIVGDVVAEYIKDHTKAFWQDLNAQYEKATGNKVELQVVDWNVIDQQVEPTQPAVRISQRTSASNRRARAVPLPATLGLASPSPAHSQVAAPSTWTASVRVSSPSSPMGVNVPGSPAWVDR